MFNPPLASARLVHRCLPALLLAACARPTAPNPPPVDRFYFPTGVVHAAGPAGHPGYLYVASSNFDRRYDRGSVLAIDLSTVTALPPLGAAAPDDAPRAINAFSAGSVLVDSLTGELAAWPTVGGARLFLPSRAEKGTLHVIDAAGATLSCPLSGDPATDCLDGAPSLLEAATSETGKPRGPAPFGVGVSADGAVYVTHVQAADSPTGSAKLFESYLVHLNAQTPAVAPALEGEGGSYVPIGAPAASSVAVGRRYAFATGRYFSPRSPMLRLADRWRPGVVLDPSLESGLHALEWRGVGLSSDERRAFVVGRLASAAAAEVPSVLAVIDVQFPESDRPWLNLVRVVPLPQGAAELRVIERPGRGALVAVTCTAADALALYDDDVGEVVAQVSGVVSQPFGMAVDAASLPGSARIFVAGFGDGRVGVVDLPDLAHGEAPRLVGWLGRSQRCLVTPDAANCARDEAVP